MKILICTPEFLPEASGLGIVVQNITKEFKRKGHECIVCSPTGPDIKLGSLNMRKRFGGLGLLYYWYQVGKHFNTRLDRYDAVWLHHPLFLNKCPFPNALVTMHTTYHGYEKLAHFLGYSYALRVYYKFMSRVEGHSLRKIDKKDFLYTVDSPQVEFELEAYGLDSEITYVPNGADIDKFRPIDSIETVGPLRKRFGIPDDHILLLWVGRLTGQKQPDKLIDVFSIIEERSDKISLVIAGDGELLERTKSLAHKRGLRNTRFLGHVDHEILPELYACSDFYIMTSRYEGQPLTLLEAMACGLPPIVSDIPNLEYFVTKSGSGTVIDFTGDKRAADQILEYIKSTDVKEHGAKARNFAEKNLSWNVIADRYLDLLKG